jgi:hypothetical protein
MPVSRVIEGIARETHRQRYKSKHVKDVDYALKPVGTAGKYDAFAGGVDAKHCICMA